MVLGSALGSARKVSGVVLLFSSCLCPPPQKGWDPHLQKEESTSHFELFRSDCHSEPFHNAIIRFPSIRLY